MFIYLNIVQLIVHLKYNNKPNGNQMENEVKEKPELIKKRKTVVMTVSEIPTSVHNKIKEYRTKINYERKRTFSLKAAYREFLIEKTK